MKILLKPIKTDAEISSPLLRARAERLSAPSCKYLALWGNDEVGFVVLDFHYREFVEFVVLYEIIVDRPFRQKGIGTEVLLEVERMVRARGDMRIRLTPEPFESEGSIAREDLVRWYAKYGFKHVPGSALGEMEKDLR